MLAQILHAPASNVSALITSNPVNFVFVDVPAGLAISHQPLQAAMTGFLTGLGLIAAIGAQNAWVIRQGIRREHIGKVITICVLSDLLLIALGTIGIDGITRTIPWLLSVLTWGGVAYLIFFACLSFRSALHPQALETDKTKYRVTAAHVVGTTLALTWLNPHVYLDTVLMLGTVINSFGHDRWAGALGASTASLLWFTTLGLGASMLSRVLAKPRTWRIIDFLVGCTMIGIAVHLILQS